MLPSDCRGLYDGSRRLPLLLVPADYQPPSTLVKMMPLHQMMPAANPEPERLPDETSVKTIQTKVNKLDPAVPVRACRRAWSLAALTRFTNPADSPTNPPIA